MYYQTVAIIAAIMLLAFASSLLYTLGSVNGMNNVTNENGSSRIMPNNTFGCVEIELDDDDARRVQAVLMANDMTMKQFAEYAIVKVAEAHVGDYLLLTD